MIKIFITALVAALLTVVIISNLNQGDLPDVEITDSTQDSNQSTELVEEDTNVEINEDIEKPLVNSSRVLDLSNQGLTKTPDYVFERTEIQELNLSGNNLSGALQAEVRHLQNLKVLDLSNNNFTGVPAEVGQLNSLEVLDLSNNNFTGLPYELGNLSNLKVMDLRGNDYSSQDLEVVKEGLPNTTVVQID